MRLIRSFAVPLREINCLSFPLLTFVAPDSVLCRYSETTPQGKKTTKLNQTLLNGNNICMVGTLSFVLIVDLVNDQFYSLSQEAAVLAKRTLVNLSTYPRPGILSGARVHDSQGLGYQMSKYSWPTLHNEDTTNRCIMLYEKGKGWGQTQ